MEMKQVSGLSLSVLSGCLRSPASADLLFNFIGMDESPSNVLSLGGSGTTSKLVSSSMGLQTPKDFGAGFASCRRKPRTCIVVSKRIFGFTAEINLQWLLMLMLLLAA